MSRAYSEYVYWLKGVAKEHGMSVEEARDRLCEVALANPHDEVAVMNMVVANMESRALDGDCMHYFITGKGMENWLEEVAPSLDEEQFKLLMTTTMVQVGNQQTVSAKTFMIHFEGGDSSCWLVSIQNGGFDVISQCWNPGCLLSACSGRHGAVFMASPKSLSILGSNPEGKRFINLLSGFLCYLSAFPDCVTDGIPDDLKHPNHFKGKKCVRIDGNRALVPGTHDSPVPHWRKGHMRYLTSPFYTHKRNHAVFIAGTFVNGPAITVTGIEGAGAAKAA